MGALLIDWTARGAVACCLCRLLVRVGRRGGLPGRGEWGLWLAGWVLLVAHMALAFHFRHGWRHAAAYEHTAARTEATTGLRWGGGVYFNYATAAVWGLDAAVIGWERRRGRRLPAWWRWSVGVYLALMMLSATVVFGPTWWWGVAAVFVVALAGVRFRRQPIDAGIPRSGTRRGPPPF